MSWNNCTESSVHLSYVRKVGGLFIGSGRTKGRWKNSSRSSSNFIVVSNNISTSSWKKETLLSSRSYNIRLDLQIRSHTMSVLAGRMRVETGSWESFAIKARTLPECSLFILELSFKSHPSILSHDLLPPSFCSTFFPKAGEGENFVHLIFLRFLDSKQAMRDHPFPIQHLFFLLKQKTCLFDTHRFLTSFRPVSIELSLPFASHTSSSVSHLISLSMTFLQSSIDFFRE